jgi:hypothetical protein
MVLGTECYGIFAENKIKRVCAKALSKAASLDIKGVENAQLPVLAGSI